MLECFTQFHKRISCRRLANTSVESCHHTQLKLFKRLENKARKEKSHLSIRFLTLLLFQISELEKQLAARDQPRPEMLPKFEFLRAEEPARGQPSVTLFLIIYLATLFLKDNG